MLKTTPSLLILILACAQSAQAKDCVNLETAKSYPPYENQLAGKHSVGDEPFLYAVRCQVSKCWFPPHLKSKCELQIRFTLAKAGVIESSQLLKSSGTKSFDDSVVEALYAEALKFTNVAQPENLEPIELSFTNYPISGNKVNVIKSAFLGDERINTELEEQNLSSNPESVSARLALVKDALRLGHRDEAIYLLEEGLGLYPTKDAFSSLLKRIKSREI